MKYLLYKLRKDLQSLFGYPRSGISVDSDIDHETYWRKRRPQGTPVLSDWQKQRADYTIPLIQKGAYVLDIGCGDGAVLQYLSERKQTQGTGVEINPTMAVRARSLGISIIEADLSNLAAVRRLPEVDHVLAFEVIEHLANPEAVLKILTEKAKQSVIVSVPNTGYYAHRLRLLLGRFPLQWVVQPGEHLRFWTVRDMEWWIAALGFKLNRLILYAGLPLLNKLWPRLFGQGMIVEITKE